MLEGEGAFPASKGAGDALHRDVAGGAFDAAAEGQHLADAGALQIAVEGLVDRHAADRAFTGADRRELHVKGTDRFNFHHVPLHPFALGLPPQFSVWNDEAWVPLRQSDVPDWERRSRRSGLSHKDRISGKAASAHRDFERRRVCDRKVYRAGNEAVAVNLVVDRLRLPNVSAFRDEDRRPQGSPEELPGPIRVDLTDANGIVGVAMDHDLGAAGEV
jgi:hypothetical protein